MIKTHLEEIKKDVCQCVCNHVCQRQYDIKNNKEKVQVGERDHQDACNKSDVLNRGERTTP